MENELSSTCPCCGEVYELNLCFGNDAPYSYYQENGITFQAAIKKARTIYDWHKK